jgi:2-polyprenyl-3-methyl-5-hydroxy-6-metoxy-1,4-benzoquinol methylase
MHDAGRSKRRIDACTPAPLGTEMNNDAPLLREAGPAAAKLKYSKSSAFYLGTKADFFSANDELLHKALRQNQRYATQPRRSRCKICDSTLPEAVDFHSHGVDYIFCSQCSHLNGGFEDTQEFVEELYISGAGSDYSHNYIDGSFTRRAADIYAPKADFLIGSITPGEHEILDVGCGSGYFVYAALQRGLRATGVDVSKTMVDFGNRQIAHHLNSSPLSSVSEQGFYDAITGSAADVISAIGVIEHLRQPHKFFDAFRQSRARYLYYSVPMFSLSVALENIFKDVFPRQLSGGHTHLFTEPSIQKMHDILGVKSVAEWRFGTDVMDLYRHTLTSLKKNHASQKMMDYLGAGLGKQVDAIQSVFDQNHFCSEIHCVAAKS